MPCASLSSTACTASGSSSMSRFAVSAFFVLPPSMAYAASVHGDPTKPRSVVRPSVSERSCLRISPTKGIFSRNVSGAGISTALSRSTLSIGVSMTGPLPRTTSNSMPKAGSGVRMSLKKITPSVPYACHGCRDSLMAISGVSDRWRKGYFSEYSRNAAM